MKKNQLIHWFWTYFNDHLEVAISWATLWLYQWKLLIMWKIV